MVCGRGPGCGETGPSNLAPLATARSVVIIFSCILLLAFAFVWFWGISPIGGVRLELVPDYGNAMVDEHLSAGWRNIGEYYDFPLAGVLKQNFPSFMLVPGADGKVSYIEENESNPHGRSTSYKYVRIEGIYKDGRFTGTWKLHQVSKTEFKMYLPEQYVGEGQIITNEPLSNGHNLSGYISGVINYSIPHASGIRTPDSTQFYENGEIDLNIPWQGRIT